MKCLSKHVSYGGTYVHVGVNCHFKTSQTHLMINAQVYLLLFSIVMSYFRMARHLQSPVFNYTKERQAKQNVYLYIHILTRYNNGKRVTYNY